MALQLYKVFVYGTLKRGEPNHGWFSKDKEGQYKFLCEAETVQKFPLVIGSKYNIPFLLYKPGVGNNVKGEVYEVDKRVFDNLDILEDHPNFYIREEQDVRSLSDKSVIKTWMYFIKNFKPELLNNKYLTTYSTKGDHGLQYVTRLGRDPDYIVKDNIIIKT